MEHSVHSLASSIVRIRNAQGSVVGAGFLAAEGLVCTCAHVVAAALGTPPNAKSRPEGDVQLEFFLDGSTSSGTVEAWHPQGGPQPEDIAVLRLNAAPLGRVRAARLVCDALGSDRLWYASPVTGQNTRMSATPP